MTSNSDWAIFIGGVLGFLVLLTLVFGGMFSPHVESEGGIYTETTIASTAINSEEQLGIGSTLIQTFGYFPPILVMGMFMVLIVMFGQRAFRHW